MSLRTPSLLFAILLSSAAHAADPTEATLKQTLEDLTSTKAQAEQVQAKQSRNQTELESLKRQSLRMADEIRTLESKIAGQAKASQAVEARRAAKEAELGARREEIATLLYGMIRMQRLPRQFVLAHPGDADSLLRTASALQVAYGSTHSAASELAGSLASLQHLTDEANEARAQLQDQQKELSDKMADLTSSMQDRQALQRRLDKDHSKLTSKINQLSEKSKSLHELIEQIDREEAIFRALGAPTPKPKAPGSPKEPPSFTAQKGNIPYPAAGQLIHRYGQKKAPGETYNGHVLKTAAGAMVSAPHHGRVVFTGPFMEYGNMVIIQHDDNYHTVLAGLDVIQAEPGQNVAAGEPVGVMGNTVKTQELYLEVRKHSKAIDPASWMGHLPTEVAHR